MSDQESPPPEAVSRAADRLIFFSDAVVAIAMTLLALSLPIPTGSTMGQIWTSLGRDAGAYEAFLISFLVIFAAWTNHHDLFQYLESTTSRLRLVNMAWLLTIVLVPFATRLLTTFQDADPGGRLARFGFYALLQVMQSLLLLALVKIMASGGHLSRHAQPVVRMLAWQAGILAVSFGVSIPLFLLTSDAWVLWYLGPLAGGLSYRYRRRKRQAAT